MTLRTQESLWVMAMNQIRNCYGSMVPGVTDRFVTGVTDDYARIARSYGLPPDAGYSIWHFFVTVPGMIAVVDGAIAGIIAATPLGPFGIPTIGLGGLAVLTGVATTLLLGLQSKRKFDGFVVAHQPRFRDLRPQMPGDGSRPPRR